MSATHPLYRRRRPGKLVLTGDKGDPLFIDLSQEGVHLPAYGAKDPVADAARRFDDRAGAAIRAGAESVRAMVDGLRFIPGGPGGGHFESAVDVAHLLEKKSYGDEAPDVFIPTAQCLAVIAYPDYFPGVHDDPFRHLVSAAILEANPGWCGSYGPGVDGLFDVIDDASNGDYDMAQMHLVPIVYRYYDELSSEAREHLITQLLARGTIHRPGREDIFTSGGPPNDWSTAGIVDVTLSPFKFLKLKFMRIGETENHILMMHTARYLANQLLYQRDPKPDYDNRKKHEKDTPSCTGLMLSLLRNILRGDFSEYNAKPYQTQTRLALLNLCSYAYDHEVRLAARMVLDYVSARTAACSNDLRRMVPFRRINDEKNAKCDARAFLDISLVETTFGSDPMAQHFAMLAGNTRVYETRGWHIKTNDGDGHDSIQYAVSDYRLPAPIHDLFVNDAHRRFYQRLHRRPQDDPDVTGRNCDNHEITAGSPSYLITAGGAFATWAIDPGPVSLSAKLRKKSDQQLGVAVTTSFIPTTRKNFDYCGDPYRSQDLIQFGRYSEVEGVNNYGVAPDFACGPDVHLPAWCVAAIEDDRRKHPGDAFGRFAFVDKKQADDGPGFFLAFLGDGDFTVMEAFDTWLHPDLRFEQFKALVFAANRGLLERGLRDNVEDQYMTMNGNVVRFVIRDSGDDYGAVVLGVHYGEGDPMDRPGDAGAPTDQFLHGTVLNSPKDGVVEITNHFLGQRITLDLSDSDHPRRTDEHGVVEEAGNHHEVWVNFHGEGSQEGNFFHPFHTLAAATAAVAEGGVVRMMPGTTRERVISGGGKRMTLVAPIGGVTIGAR